MRRPSDRKDTEALTGTKNSTPVTMDVNAVPPILREYALPSTPTTNAPMDDTTSERLKI